MPQGPPRRSPGALSAAQLRASRPRLDSTAGGTPGAYARPQLGRAHQSRVQRGCGRAFPCGEVAANGPVPRVCPSLLGSSASAALGLGDELGRTCAHDHVNVLAQVAGRSGAATSVLGGYLSVMEARSRPNPILSACIRARGTEGRICSAQAHRRCACTRLVSWDPVLGAVGSRKRSADLGQGARIIWRIHELKVATAAKLREPAASNLRRLRLPSLVVAASKGANWSIRSPLVTPVSRVVNGVAAGILNSGGNVSPGDH